MEKLMINKKGLGLLRSSITFIIFTIVITAALAIFIGWIGTGVSIKEQIYAKQLALLIDQAKPGTELTIDISEMYDIAKKNKFKGKPIEIDYADNRLIVKLTQGKGYGFRYFTELESGSVTLDETNKLMRIKV
jgi:hypothetical protein